jgi:CubicO group peptidase (beta-lactamase class C family)
MASHQANGFAQAQAQIEKAIERGEIGGAGLAVVHEGRLAIEWYAGEAAPGVPSSSRVLWPLAAISKLYTAATIMALVERGALTLGLPVCSLLPELAGEGRETITLRHLLTHTSGLLYEPPDMEALLLAQQPLDELVDAAFTAPLQFPPGSQFAYSDLGYAVAGLVAEAATGQRFPTLLRELILEPAGLRETFFPLPPEAASRLARVVGALGEGTPGHMYGASYGLRLGHPAWGVVATLPDLVRFGLLFTPEATSRVLSAATICTMTTDQVRRFFRPDLPSWGLGFAIGQGSFGEGDLFSSQSFGLSGATGCALWYDPRAHVLIAFVSNRHMNADRLGFTRRLSAVLNTVMAAFS